VALAVISKTETVQALLDENIEDYTVVHTDKYIEALYYAKNNMPNEYARFMMRIKGKISLRDLERCIKAHGDKLTRVMRDNAKETYALGGKNQSDAEDSLSASLDKYKPDGNPRYEWNDIGSGNLFADLYKDTLRYVPERKSWFYYNGAVWLQDTGGLKAMEMCKNFIRQWMTYAFNITDERKRTEYIKFIARCTARKNRETILRDAQGVHPVSMSVFDKDPLVFNCANVTLFFQGGNVEARKHLAGDFLTKISDVIYDPDARNERWNRFIPEIMSGDEQKSCYLQKSFGYPLTGDTSLECMFFLYGATTRNGKGSLCESVLRVMGGYGCTVRPESISLKSNNNSQAPTEDVARLNGVHLTNISEPGKGLVLNAALLKSMTGNDTLNARYLHENSFDFRPQFKIFINTNYLPIVTDITLFSSGRLVIIPFERHFAEKEQDKTLKQGFAKPEAQSAILNWLIEGWRLLKSEGLEPPDCIKTATEAYRHVSDKIGLFIEECLEPSPNGETRTSDAYRQYQEWCNDNGYFVENARNFKQSLQGTITIERKRPRSGGGLTTLIMGYKLAHVL
jgi:putative DNA primase/helicase